jgi:hypothetical protein
MRTNRGEKIFMIEGNGKVNEMARKCKIQESIKRYLLHLEIKKRLALKGKKKGLFDPLRYEPPQRAIRKAYDKR